MIEDKYIGIIIAITGSVGIGSSFIFTKKVRQVMPCVNLPTLRISLFAPWGCAGLDSGRKERRCGYS